jgi:hypothetical protein
MRRVAALGCAETVHPFIDRDSKNAARVPLLHYILPEESPMVRAWRMMALRARDSARGMLALDVFADRVVRTMPTAEVPTRHRDGVRSRRV